jgi:hypothetical protein
VNGADLRRVDPGATADDHLVISPPVLTHVPFQRHLRVVRVVDTPHHPKALLWRIDVNLDARPLDQAATARCQRELLCRDAHQGTGWPAGPARSHAKRHGHFNASLSAGTLAKLEAPHQHAGAAAACSLARLQRRAFNHQLRERISQP